MLSQAFDRFISVLFFLYPLLIFLAVKFISPAAASGILCVILVGSLFFVKKENRNTFGKMFDVVLWVVLINNLANLYFKSELVLRLYPFFMSFAAASFFIYSLFRGPPVIESFARLQNASLTSDKLIYIRKLTLVWSIWLSVNTLISFYTVVVADFETWAMYNNLIFYLVSGTLILGDLYIRRFRHV